MRAQVRIPEVGPNAMQPPAVCPYEGCRGRHFKNHELHCDKPLRDTRIDRVEAYRRKCLSCGRTHRVYPRGVSRAQQSDRVKALSLLLYVLGLSYRAVEDLLQALGVRLDHTSVYRNVQAAGAQVRKLRRMWMKQFNGKIAVLGGDITYVRRGGEQVAVGIAVNSADGMILSIEVLGNEEIETLKAWLKPLLKLVHAEVLVTDDQDGFKTVADEAGVRHQVCRRHVTSNVLDFVVHAAEKVLENPPAAPKGLEVTPAQLLEDLALLEWIMLGQPENALQLLAMLYDRYAFAKGPARGRRASLWYRMRNHVLRLWNNWERYTCCRTTTNEEETTVPETNNATEQVIGWTIKERYRTMRGYKREESILNVAMLTGWMREQPTGRDLSALFAS
jgi:transposase-like protein